MIYALLTGICWIIFIAVWLVSAFTAKRTVKRSWSFFWWRLAIVAIIILLIRAGVFDNFNRSDFFYISSNPLVGAFGLVCCALGVALAIWARFYLGRNWGMPMSLKESPELVTTGPYAYVRHPIYTGVLFAMFGTILTAGVWWLAVLVVTGSYFIYSATQEEKIMTKEFPDTYPAYKKRTKMLIPFVF